LKTPLGCFSSDLHVLSMFDFWVHIQNGKNSPLIMKDFNMKTFWRESYMTCNCYDITSFDPWGRGSSWPLQTTWCIISLQLFKHNMTRETSHGLTPSSPPCRNYKIAPVLIDISNFSLEIPCWMILLKATPMHDAKVHSFHSPVGQPFGMLPWVVAK
jgi:hypothetical protein